MSAAWLSLRIGFVAATAAMVLGTLAAIALVRFREFRGRFLLTAMVNAPLVMPEIITGITQLLLLISMLHLFGWPHRGMLTIVLAHVTFCTAYVTVTVQSRLASADRSLEEAAMDLGSGPGARLHRHDAADHRPGAGQRLAAELHALARRPRDLELRLGPGRQHAADGHLLQGQARRQPGHQRAGDAVIATVGVGVLIAGVLMRRAERQRQRDLQLAAQ